MNQEKKVKCALSLIKFIAKQSPSQRQLSAILCLAHIVESSVKAKNSA